MLAASQSKIVFKTINQLIIPELKDNQKRLLISVLRLLIVFSLSITFILSHHLYNDNIDSIVTKYFRCIKY
ncbi:hypothetical protein D3O61_05375 [Vibrio vulnificus]|nr:hypothetical protein [Vibrio vulnificus]